MSDGCPLGRQYSCRQVHVEQRGCICLQRIANGRLNNRIGCVGLVGVALVETALPGNRVDFDEAGIFLRAVCIGNEPLLSTGFHVGHRSDHGRKHSPDYVDDAALDGRDIGLVYPRAIGPAQMDGHDVGLHWHSHRYLGRW